MYIDLLAQSAGLGGYISIWKVAVFTALFVVWAWSGSWIDKDAEKVHTSRDFWNLLYMACGAGSIIFWFILPAPFWLDLLLSLVICGMIGAVYILHRNARVEPNETILTPGHIRWLLSPSDDKKDVELRLEFISVNDNDLPVPHKEDKEYTGYVISEELLHDMWKRRVSHAELIPNGEDYDVRYVIDGIASVVDKCSREEAIAGIVYLKAVAGLDVEDKRRPQKGSFFTIRTGEQTTGWRIFTSGSTRGEQLVLERSVEDLNLTLEGSGFYPEQVARLREIVKQSTGLVLVSGPKGSGVTTTLYSLIRAHDAFIQNIHSLEMEVIADLDNITQHKVRQDTEAKSHARQLQTVLHGDPEVVMVGFCDEPEMAKLGTQFASEGRKVFFGFQANTALGALQEWVKLVGRNDKVSKTLVAITNQRLVRKLCTECREAYAPDANLIRRVNLPTDKIKQFYRPPSEILHDKRGNPILCPTCQGAGYHGRTAVFETIFISDALRELIAAKAAWDVIATQCRKERILYLQEQALRKVIDGTTSIQEVLRVTSSKPRKTGDRKR
jgi:type II secretory ATPase GspE/PulE/Tfp pilus assembly ATPase PilB-like protein